MLFTDGIHKLGRSDRPHIRLVGFFSRRETEIGDFFAQLEQGLTEDRQLVADIACLGLYRRMVG